MTEYKKELYRIRLQGKMHPLLSRLRILDVKFEIEQEGKIGD